MAVNGYKFTALTGGGAGAIDAQDGATLQDGDLAIVMVGGLLYHYELDDDSGLAESSPDVIEPDTNAGNKRWILQRVPQTNIVPIGTIVAWSGGYFANSANGGFVNELGNDVASVNSYVNGDNWYVCDGAELNLSSSPIYNGSGRHLPNLTDSRFIMGSTAAGTTGGNNSMAHTHTVNIAAFTSGSTTLTTSQVPAHRHELAYATVSTVDQYEGSKNSFNWDGAYNSGYWTTNTGGGGSHSHNINPPTTTSSGASNTENRPAFLSCFYLQKAA